MEARKTETWKLKRWFNVYAPKVLGGEVIAEVPASDEKSMVGRNIEINLSWLTKKPEHSFMGATLHVTGAEGTSAQTELKRLEQSYSYTHSLARRYSSVIYTVDKVKDKNGRELVVKLIIVTRDRITTTKKTAIRKMISEFTRNYVAGMDYEDFVKSVIEERFQSEGASRVKSIVPVKRLEVRKLEL
ncbi:MAG: hypothetical protein QXF41_02575 [Candidatus Micrarchaeaceae archaeon]